MKKLLAAAVAAAVIAPASVMAAGPTLYGKLHLVVSNNDNNGSSNAGTKYDEWSMSDRSSRIGVKGSEDLGNGMKVGYLIEWGIAMDGTANDMRQRNRAITLSGDWGTALVGKWDTPFKSLGRKVDLFGDSIGDFRNLHEQEFRLDNVIAYVTPNMSGFSATIAYSFDHSEVGFVTDDGYPGESTDNSAYSFNAIYNNGPIMVGVGYTNASLNDVTSAPAGVEDSMSAWRVAGSYEMGDFKVLAGYTDYTDNMFVDGADPSVWTLGGSYKMGNNTIKLQYADRDESDSNMDDEADMWVIGLDHALSKRTNVYVTYASVDNDTNSARTPWRAAMSSPNSNGLGVADEDADSFAVGIIHKF